MGLVGEEEDFLFPYLLGYFCNVGNCFIFPIVSISVLVPGRVVGKRDKFNKISSTLLWQD